MLDSSIPATPGGKTRPIAGPSPLHPRLWACHMCRNLPEASARALLGREAAEDGVAVVAYALLQGDGVA